MRSGRQVDPALVNRALVAGKSHEDRNLEATEAGLGGVREAEDDGRRRGRRSLIGDGLAPGWHAKCRCSPHRHRVCPARVCLWDRPSPPRIATEPLRSLDHDPDSAPSSSPTLSQSAPRSPSPASPAVSELAQSVLFTILALPDRQHQSPACISSRSSSRASRGAHSTRGTPARAR